MSEYIHTVEDYRKQIVWFLFITVICVGFLYGYYLNQAINNVIYRESAEHKALDLATDIGELEFQYISALNSINLREAYSNNFVDAPNPVFVSRERADNSIAYRFEQSD